VNQQIIDTGTPVIAEEFVDVADARHYFHTVKFPIKDALGQIEAIGGISLDITERKQAEEALRQSEERFRQMAENIHEVFWMANPELTQMLYVSPAYEAIWGRTCASLYAQPRSFIEAIYPDDRERVVAALEQHRQSGLSHEYRIVQPDGSVRWIWERGFPVRNQAGQLESFVGVSQDISNRKQTEEALRESEARFRLLAENSTDMISRHTPEEGIFLYASPACQTLLGYAPEELVGHSAYEFFHPDDLAQIRKSHVTILDLPVTDTVAYRHSCKNGHYLWLETTCHTIRDQHTGAVLEIQSASRDITDRKRVEEALRQQVEREQLMARMTQRIHQSLNLEEILNTTVAEVRQYLECDRVIIYRLESHQSGVVVVESVAAGWRNIAGTMINDCYFAEKYFQLYQQGRIQALEDIYTANLTPCHVDLLARFQVKANLVVPIVHEEQLWGLLVAQQCSGTRQWHSSEIDLLKSLATQSAIAIQKSELYAHSQVEIAQRQQAEAALQQQFHQGQLVGGIAQRIRKSLNLEEILNTTVVEVRHFLDTDRVLIYRLWPNGTGSALTEAVVPGLPVVLGRTFPEEVFPQDSHELYRQGRILAISDVQQAEVLPCLVEFVQQFGVRAKLVVPILQEETLWGLLIAHHCREPRQWQPLEIDLLKQLATQVGIALHQAELYEQSRTATATALTQAQQLEQALSELQKTQAQLVQSEKMSSLGQLVAGVAHEINNPVTFISGNLTHAENYTQDLLGLIQRYQEQYPNPTPEISSQMDAIDLEFLIEDLPNLLDSMKVGAERICEIISALRNFSRHAEAEIKAVDIHEGLDSTLMILQSRLKAQGKYPEIQVIKQYGNLPLVECYVGQLNQVFMNLLSNAIDALEELKVEGLNPWIRITTEVLNNREVAIRIADNGPGMTQQVKGRIFDPFYSTKAVGSGMGLGLSISYQIIVERHGGQLQCESILGQGTEFVIQIPLGQRQSQIGVPQGDTYLHTN
jgi:PAS domain S-box-containing protein